MPADDIYSNAVNREIFDPLYRFKAAAFAPTGSPAVPRHSQQLTHALAGSQLRRDCRNHRAMASKAGTVMLDLERWTLPQKSVDQRFKTFMAGLTQRMVWRPQQALNTL
jgi:hypothetical protein